MGLEELDLRDDVRVPVGLEEKSHGMEWEGGVKRGLVGFSLPVVVPQRTVKKGGRRRRSSPLKKAVVMSPIAEGCE